jgi:ATP-dependent helicase HepA
MSGAGRAEVLAVGRLVEHHAVPGIGRISAVEGSQARVDCFESVAAPVVGSRWVPADECHHATLLPQTRVYWQNPDTGVWATGRVIGGDSTAYFIRLPNSQFDVKVPESELRVRWDRPVADPLDVLIAGANESPYFRDARLPMLRSLVSQRAACAGTSALLSASVEIYPHQISAALTVLSDPVRRYLLADEVGLGKTIEAGLIIRQVLLDQPRSKVVVIAPNALRLQWQSELRDKFFIQDFPDATIKITAHETCGRWADYHAFDLAVVDEAHRLASVDSPDQSPYRELAAIAHSVPQLLLLSATPLMARPLAYLGLLHLLDPSLYRWEDQPGFQRKFDARRQLATAVYALDAEFEPLLPSAIQDIQALIPEDERFHDLAAEATGLLTSDGVLRDEACRPALAAHVEALRAHIAETYRLHRRTIRHRRAQVLRDNGDAAVMPFEITGRTAPEQIVVDGLRLQTVQDAMLSWQATSAAWIQDHADTGTSADYGRALAVLASRADGVSDDFADALRWRLHHDDAAAVRAGLTEEERAFLTAAEVLPAEADVLKAVGSLKMTPEVAALAEAIFPVLRRRRRVVIFCGGGEYAARLADHLRQALPEGKAGEHTARQPPRVSEAAVAKWREHGGVLIADESAEDGLNLQEADAIVHCRLPWSPNRLEQRIGRADRYSGTAGSRAAGEYVITSPEGEFAFPGAWLSLLTDGFGVFAGSVSALQDAIESALPEVWEVAVCDGPEGMAGLAARVAEDMARERKEIDSVDMLESAYQTASGTREVASSIGELEADWRAIETAVIGYAGDGAGGLRFSWHRAGPRHQVVHFERGKADPLMPPRLLALSGRSVRPAMMEGGFNRTAALRLPGTRMFRAGQPFFELLAAAVAVDDRGQASALWRRVAGLADEPSVYFGFDYLAEANIDAALQIASGSVNARRAIRRQADRIFEPFTRRIWMPAGSETAVSHPGLTAWLDRPYSPTKSDANLNATRIDQLLDLFSGKHGFERSARRAEAAGRTELDRVSDLPSRCEAAREQGLRVTAVQRAQARARQAAGRILNDTESYLADVRLAEALIDGLAEPTVKLVSVTCLVRGNVTATHVE